MDANTSDWLLKIGYGITGGALTLVGHKFLNKQGRFTYSVNHFNVGISTSDAVFGDVQVTWNKNPVPNLYLSTIELVNKSLNDYENVIVRAYTGDTLLLTESAIVVNSTQTLKWTKDYATKVQVAPGQAPTPEQFALHSGQREFLIPIINRGQTVKFQFLNAAKTQNPPTIWLDIAHKGVKLEFQNPCPMILDVPQSAAALLGLILGLIGVAGLLSISQPSWVVGFGAFILGSVGSLLGVLCIKLWNWSRRMLFE